MVVVEARGQRCGQLGAAPVEGELAAGPEPAAAGRAKERRRLAGDLGQPLELDVEPREGAEQPPRVGVQGLLEQREHGRVLGHAGRVHHDDVVCRLGDDAQIVRDQDDGRAVVSLQLAG